MTAKQLSVGLVLGSGGVLGVSFHAGVLLAIEETWGIKTRGVNEILGTSAGAVTGAMLAAGLSPQDLLRREQGLPLSRSGKKITNRYVASGDNDRSIGAINIGWPAAPQLAIPAMRWPGTVAPGTVLAGLLPRGQGSTKNIGAMVDAILEGSWPTTPRLRTVTVSLRSGRRHILSETSNVDIGAAVAASCAVPGIHSPIRTDGDEYVDGAVHSVNNLDAIGAHDLVIVSSPSTSRSVGFDPMAPARNLWSMQLRRERRAVEAPSTTVVVIEPDQAVLDAMGTDPMAKSRRASVAVAAHTMAKAMLVNQQYPLEQ